MLKNLFEKLSCLWILRFGMKIYWVDRNCNRLRLRSSGKNISLEKLQLFDFKFIQSNK